jgi:hypothetical protein
LRYQDSPGETVFNEAYPIRYVLQLGQQNHLPPGHPRMKRAFAGEPRAPAKIPLDIAINFLYTRISRCATRVSHNVTRVTFGSPPRLLVQQGLYEPATGSGILGVWFLHTGKADHAPSIASIQAKACKSGPRGVPDRQVCLRQIAAHTPRQRTRLFSGHSRT